MKFFPVCYAAHRLINSATALRDSPACRVEAIREVRVSLGKTQSQILCYRAPTNSLEAKFSVEFAAAAALLAGHVGLGELDEGYLQRRDVRSEEHTSELQSLMRISYAVYCLKKKK